MSFAQEMKDFVTAWTAVSEIGSRSRQLDLQKQEIENLKAYREDTLALDRDQFELSRTNSDRNYGLAAERNAIARDEAEARKAAAILEGLSGDGTANLDWSTGEETYDAGDGGDGGGYDTAIPTEYTFQARGGMVARAAEGGVIEEDPDLPFVDKTKPYVDPKMNENVRVIPAIPTRAPARPAAAPAAEPQEQSAYDAMGNATGASDVDPEAAKSVAAGAAAAVADAAPKLIEDAKKPDAAVGEDGEKMDIVNNRGGLSLDEWKELVSTIDPNNTIPGYMKSAAVLSSTYKYFMENGQPEKAAKVAKGILIMNKQMTQTLGALAVNALEDGNMEAAARLLSDAADQFPTGQKFQVVPTENGVAYQMMENGEVANQGELTTDQFWALAGKVKDGSLFIEEMGRLAESTNNRSGGPRNETEALQLVNNAYVDAMMAKQAFDAVDPNNPDRTAEEDVSEEELDRLRTEAERARSVYERFKGNALQMGIKRTDISATNRDALDMAIPEEAPAAEASSEQPGWFGNAMKFIADGLTPSNYSESAVPDDTATPQGNLPPPPADVLATARAAIARGAPMEAVRQRLAENGYSAEGL